MNEPRLQQIYDSVQPKTKAILFADRIIREGNIALVASEGATPQPCKATLLSNGLLLTDDANKLLLHFPFSGTIRLRNELPNQVQILADKKSFALLTESPEQQHEWTRAIRFTLDGLIPPQFIEQNGELVWNPRGGLTDREISILNQFKEQFEKRELSVEQALFCDDARYIKYLRARSWDIPKATQMLADTLVWRDQFKPHKTTIEEIQDEHRNGWCYVSQHTDKLGRPLVYMRPVLDVRKHTPAKVRHLIMIQEDSLRRCESHKTGIEKMVWLVDFDKKETKLSEIKDGVKTAIEMVQILQGHYPERLGKAFFLDAPSAFEIGWKMVTPYLDPVTQRKIVFVRRKKNLADMLEYFDSDQLEEQFGGTNSFKFDFDQWKEEKLAQIREDQEQEVD